MFFDQNNTERAIQSSIPGSIMGLMGGGPAGLLTGAAIGGGGQAVGDAIWGDNNSNSFLEETARGATGGAAVGAAPLLGIALKKFLQKKGMKIDPTLLNFPAAGAVVGGISSGMAHGFGGE